MAPAWNHGSNNQKYTQGMPAGFLKINMKELQALIQLLEVVYDQTVIEKPISPLPFRWFNDDDPTCCVLNVLPIPSELVRTILAAFNTDLPDELDALAFYLYHCALPAKKQVVHRKHVSKLGKIENDIVSVNLVLRACVRAWC